MTTTPDTTTTTEAAAKKNTQKLQRAIVDGLEDVKAHDIQIFNTEKLSPLFERVVVASGTSNRQTRALAASVRDAVKEAGFNKPRIEGEDNGEWIIVDCGPAVVHIMQPAIRQYYHLEELWGETPVRLKLGAAKPALPVKAPVKKAAEPASPSLRRSSAAKSAIKAAERAAKAETAPPKRKPAAKKSAVAAPAKRAAAKVPAKAPAKPPTKAPVKATAKTPAKPAAKAAAKLAAKKAAAPRKG